LQKKAETNYLRGWMQKYVVVKNRALAYFNSNNKAKV